MSAQYMRDVLDADLEPTLKAVAIALVSHAREHEQGGRTVYPGIPRLRWLTGYSESAVKKALKELVRLQILEPVDVERGGRGVFKGYRVIPENMPSRGTWDEFRASRAYHTWLAGKGHQKTPSGRIREGQKGSPRAPKGVSSSAERGFLVRPYEEGIEEHEENPGAGAPQSNGAGAPDLVHEEITTPASPPEPKPERHDPLPPYRSMDEYRADFSRKRIR